MSHRKILFLAIVGVLLLYSGTRTVTLSFFLALLLASCAQKLIQRLRARHVPRWVTVVGILAVVLLPAAGAIVWGCFLLLQKAQSFMETILSETQSIARFDEWLYQFTTALPPKLQQLPQRIIEAVRPEEILTKVLSTLGQWTSAALSGLPSKLANTGLFLLFFLFCAIGYEEVVALIRALLPADWYTALRKLRKAFSDSLSLWGAAQLKLIGLIVMELSLGLCLIRIQHPILLATVIALVDVVPLVGSGLILLPWAMIRLLLGHKPQALALALLWLCVWGTRTILEPRFVGEKLQLPGAISLFSAVLGVSAFGFQGLVLFPILAAVLTAFFKRTKGAA